MGSSQWDKVVHSRELRLECVRAMVQLSLKKPFASTEKFIEACEAAASFVFTGNAKTGVIEEEDV